MNTSSYRGAVAYLESFIDYEKLTDYQYDNRTFNLRRMELLLELIEHPESQFRSIQIGGTNGKGSTAAMVSAILHRAGLKVGLYTSPHLISFRERIRIGEREITEEEVCFLVEKLKPSLERLRKNSSLGPPSFFEVYTALAFLFFAQQRADIAVLEVGMGGRLDATSAAPAVACALTSIDLDHVQKLGETLELIAREKAGIIRQGGVVISAPQHDEVKAVIRQVCREKNAHLREVEEQTAVTGEDDFSCKLNILNRCVSESGICFSLNGVEREYGDLFLPLSGEHQVINAAIAVGLVETLQEQGIKISEEVIREGLAKVFWPGRLEFVAGEQPVLLDSAHNPAASRTLASFIRRFYQGRKIIFVLGFSADKDITGIWSELFPLASLVILTRAMCKRAADPVALRLKLDLDGKGTLLADNVYLALEMAKQNSSNDTLICIAGSFFVVGEARDILVRRNVKWQQEERRVLC